MVPSHGTHRESAAATNRNAALQYSFRVNAIAASSTVERVEMSFSDDDTVCVVLTVTRNNRIDK